MRRTARGLSWGARSSTELGVNLITRSPARWLAHALERGALRDSVVARGLAWTWARAARVERPLQLPRSRSVIGVSGAVLGGSGVTPVAIQLADDLAARGLAVALVSHGFGARVRGAQRVDGGPGGAACGDEARLAASCLGQRGVPVFVATRMQQALDSAARALPDGGVVVLDGALQASPSRLSLACLVLDAADPWGSGSCPPLGDLRAPQAALVRAADSVLCVDSGASEPRWLRCQAALRAAQVQAPVRVTRRLVGLAPPGTAAGSGGARPIEWLRGRDFGLALALGRPERVLAQLRALGLAPRWVFEALDHRGLSALVRSKKYSRSDLWVTTAKCWLATQVATQAAFSGHQMANWLVLREQLELPADWLAALAARLSGGVARRSA